MKIQVLGGGCANCKKLAEQTELALKETGIVAEIEKITDMKEIMSFGVMAMPALAVDGKVVSSGKVLKKDEIIPLLKK